jgi:ferritin-like metal-binding protein YciE
MEDRARKLLIVGLRNAHAMEKQAQELMERQIGRTDDYPEVKRRLQDHLRETLTQKKRLEAALQEMDSSPSAIKDAVLGVGANLAAMGHAIAGDEIIKNALANHAFENYEIAAYKSLIALCKDGSVRGFVTELRASLDEEERMAKWVYDNIEKVTLQYLQTEQSQSAA